MATLSTLSNPYCQHCHCHYHHFSKVSTLTALIHLADQLFQFLIFFILDWYSNLLLVIFYMSCTSWVYLDNFLQLETFPFFLFSSSIYFDHREGIFMGSVWLFFGGCDWKITWFHPSPPNTTSRTVWNCYQSKIYFFTNCLTVILNYQRPCDYEAL